MFEIASSLSVAPLTTKTYSFFCLKADCDPDWTTELVPGPPDENWIDFKGNLLSRSAVFQLELLGARAEFGVIKAAEHIAFAQVNLENVGGNRAVTVAMKVGNDLEVANVHLEAKKLHIACDAGEKVSSFSIFDRYSNPLRLILVKDAKTHLPTIRNMYLKSLEMFYELAGDGLNALTKPPSDTSTLVVNRLCTINQKRLEWIRMLQNQLQENGHLNRNEKNDISTCFFEVDQVISETTIKIHCSSDFYDPEATQIPTVKEIFRTFTIMSTHNIENQLSHCTLAIKKDLEGFKYVAKSFLHREESIIQVKKLFCQTKETLTQARDVVFNLRRVSNQTYGPNSPQVEILDNCIAKLTFIIRKSVVHVADGPYLKNVSFLYDQILEAIGICKHILETFQPTQVLPPYLEPAFIDTISKVLALFHAMLAKWTENGSHLKQQFKKGIIKFIIKNGFLFRLYVPSQAAISVETIQAIRQVRLHLHSKESNPQFKARLENVQLHLSIPVEFDADENAEISIVPIILAYTSNPNLKPDKLARILNQQLIESLDRIVGSIPHCYRPNWVTQLKSEDWIPVKEVTHRVRWIENYLSSTNHGVFGCCWMYNHHQGIFSANEMDVLESEAAVVISE